MSRSLKQVAVVLWTAASLIVSPVFAQAQQGQSQDAAPAQMQDQQPNQPAAQPATPASPKKLDLGRKYWKGQPFFPDIFAPYTPVKVDQPTLTNTPKLNQLVQDGKLTLSLDDAVALALENNLDIRVQRYAVWVIDTQLLKAEAGGIPQPASAQQVVLGLPPAVSFDPEITAQMNWGRSNIPVNNIFTSGVGAQDIFSISGQSANYNVTYAEGFHTGTAVQLQWQNNRSSTNSPGVLFNPAVQSTLTFTISQPLLQGCCRLPATRFIIEAKNSIKISDAQFRQAVITDITTASDDYWELVYDLESVKVEQQAVSVSQKLYEDNKKQLEIGTMAPLDVLTAQSQLATDRGNLVAAQTARLLQQAKLLADITKDPLAANLRDIEIVPTTAIETPDVVENVPLPDLMAEAWANRPEMKVAELTLVNDKIEVKVTRNGLLPSLSLFGEYQAIGLAGNNSTILTEAATAWAADPNSPVVDVNGNPVTGPPALYESVPTAFAITSQANRAGLGSALNSMINANYPSYFGGLTLGLPIRNRSAQADNARAMLSERQEEVTYQQLKNNIFVAVRQAQVALEQDRAQVTASEEARKLAQQTLDAEQKRYQLGASTSYLVVQRARDLTQAEGVELRSRINLIEASIAFNQAMGRTLQANNITVADALKGKASKTPNIPGALDADGEPAPANTWTPGKK
ncbi:MAG TPA: TolC family protein [Candidatus Limnocylindrales bacterium]|nr:TolC family protein [Candidatus Limnocylindrales bacterium]